MKNQQESFEMAVKVMTCIANNAQDIKQYGGDSWSYEFCVKENNTTLERMFKYLNEEIDWASLDGQQLFILGWKKWDESDFLLCPVWLKDVFFPNEDGDSRFGCLAFGFATVNDKLDIKFENGKWIGNIKSISDGDE